jgi:hypothetical protein
MTLLLLGVRKKRVSLEKKMGSNMKREFYISVRRLSFAVATVSLLLFLEGCTKEEPSAPVFETVVTGAAKPQCEALPDDLQVFPQDASFYVRENLRSHHTLVAVQRAYKKRYFSVWHDEAPRESLEDVIWPYVTFTPKDAFGENLQPLPQAWFDAMLDEANFSEYGKVNRYAITLQFSHLRNFPTHKPLFRDPSKAGEGFPFDYLQNSAVHANEPLYVSHLSRDGAWAYVFSSYATGWLPSRSIAYMSEAEVRQWEEAEQVHLLRERIPLYDGEGNFLFYGRIGMMLPFVREERNAVVVRAVAPGPSIRPAFVNVYLPNAAVHRNSLALNKRNFSVVADGIMQSKYGWGGLYEERDCSSTLRDLFGPFGIWLPRNSKQQSHFGRVISLENLTGGEKLERIKASGVPFETLLYRKGHILLYVGTYEGRVMVLHNIWGIKTEKEGREGRVIVGRTVISSLNIGKELEGYDEGNSLLANLESMNIITQRAAEKVALKQQD